MKSLHEIRIARGGLQSGSFIALEEAAQLVLWGLDRGALQPGHVVLQVAPNPLARVQLRAIRGQEAQTSVLRPGELGGGVRPTVVSHEEMEAVGECLGEGIDEELEPLGVQRWPRSEEPGTRRRLHGAIDRAPREDLLDRSHRRPPHAVRRRRRMVRRPKRLSS